MLKAVTAEREAFYRAHEDVLGAVAALMERMDILCTELAESVELAHVNEGDERTTLVLALVETISAANAGLDNAVHGQVQRSMMRKRAEQRRSRLKLAVPTGTTGKGKALARLH